MKKLLMFFTIVLLIISIIFGKLYLNENKIEKNKVNKISSSTTNYYEKPIILVHDVSPKYFKQLKEVVKIINKYNYGNYTILFVIPDLENPPSGGKWDLRKNKEFVEYLHQLEKEGYKIELHGYKHTFHEFNCSKEECLEKLHNAELIMKECGFDNLSLFIPPAWALNNESLKVLLEHNYTIILTNKIIYPNGSSEKIINKEYTWYLKKEYVNLYLTKAKMDYYYASKHHLPFYLSIHPQTVTYGGGLEFLDKFLKFLNETAKLKQ